MGSDSAKKLLGEWIQRRYQEFILNSEKELSLPSLSPIPWIGASRRRDVYRKELSHPASAHHLKFISKNNKPQAFIWQTNAEKLKQGLRWGIIQSHSITGKVISCLGQYRVVAHERVLKGLVSNSQALKLKLLDLYQDRFTALQSIESLVNKNSTSIQYQETFRRYIVELQKIEARLNHYFVDIDCPGFDERSIAQIKADIQADIAGAQAYLQSVQNAVDLRPYNRSRGEYSVLEFVKQRMVQGLYEFQGINQDMSFSRTRYFALTRGEMNDYIEDTRKVLDDHEADPRNAVTSKHHGIYSANPNDLIGYDFSRDGLLPARQQQVITAISFIEGWDVVENKKGQKPFVSNGSEKEYLEVYNATRWRTHRSVEAAIKSVHHYILNIVKGIFVPTRSWIEEDWTNNKFHLNAARFYQYLTPIEPMWKKPVYFVKQFIDAFIDIFSGISDFGAKLVIRMPEDLINDWESSKELSSLDNALALAKTAAKQLSTEEKEHLKKILNQCGEQLNKAIPHANVKLADVDYELSSGEFNDILNSMVRGAVNFSTVFTHNIYAKDPVGGLIFTTTYLAGAGMIYLPAFSASVFGSAFVNAFTTISYAMASSPFGAAVAGSSTLAQLAAMAWDGVAHGPNGIAVNTLYQFGEDPLTIGSYALAAYTLGYILTNGIAGYQIPGLSHMLQEDLGTDPMTGYPVIGAKFAIILYEILAAHSAHHHKQPDLVKLNHDPAEKRSDEQEQIVNRFKLISWLAAHAKVLPKLEARDKFILIRQIEALFHKEESHSLKKLFYPEQHSSIAFQIFAVPLSYVPAILRFMVAFTLSFVALIKGNPLPMNPIRRAGEFLVDKIKKDLSRLLVVAANITYLVYSLIATFVKMSAYLSIMAVGRVAGLFDAKPAHATHRLFATVHKVMRTIGEFFYPARAMKDVYVAHPIDTMFKAESSYIRLLQTLSKGKLNKAPEFTLKQDKSSGVSLFASRTSRMSQEFIDKSTLGQRL